MNNLTFGEKHLQQKHRDTHVSSGTSIALFSNSSSFKTDVTWSVSTASNVVNSTPRCHAKQVLLMSSHKDRRHVAMVMVCVYCEHMWYTPARNKFVIMKPPIITSEAKNITAIIPCQQPSCQSANCYKSEQFSSPVACYYYPESSKVYQSTVPSLRIGK